MPHEYRNGIALGLTVGGAAVLLPVLMAQKLVEKNAEAERQANDQSGNGDVGAQWDGLIGVFVSPTDSLASWLATVFSIVAAYLLWQTLIETRRIGQAQTRAYISTGCHLKTMTEPDRAGERGSVQIDTEFKNIGNSPAMSVRLKATFKPLHRELPITERVIDLAAFEQGPLIIPAGKSQFIKIRRLEHWLVGGIRLGHVHAYISLQATYYDIFDESVRRETLTSYKIGVTDEGSLVLMNWGGEENNKSS